MIHIAIVEDELEMVNDLQESIDVFFKENYFEYDLKIYTYAEDFLKDYKFNFNLIFMDINLPGTDGMSAVKKLREIDSEVMVIFVTSLMQYAVKGYSVNAFDFIVKPYSYYEFSLTLNRAVINLKNLTDNHILIKNNQVTKKINLSELRYIEVLNRKLVFHLLNDSCEIYGSIKYYAQLLSEHGFVLCNVCYLVNLKYITEISKTKVKLGDDELLISRPRRKEFLSAVNKYFGEGGSV